MVFRHGVLELQEWTDEPTEELILSALPETCHEAKEKENYSTDVGFHANILSSDQDTVGSKSLKLPFHCTQHTTADGPDGLLQSNYIVCNTLDVTYSNAFQSDQCV